MEVTLPTHQASKIFESFTDLAAFRAKGRRLRAKSQVKRTRVRHCCSLQRRSEEQALGLFPLQGHNRAKNSHPLYSLMLKENYKYLNFE